MKKILFVLLLAIFFIPNVYADEEYTTVESSMYEYIPFSDLSTFSGCSNNGSSYCGVPVDMQKLYFYNEFNSFYKDSKNKSIFDKLYLEIFDYYEQNLKESYPYYFVSVAIFSTSSSEFRLNTLALKLTYNDSNDFYDTSSKESIYILYSLGNYYSVNTTGTYSWWDGNPDNFDVYQLFNNGFPMKVGVGDSATVWFYTPLYYFQSNFDWYLKNTTTVFKAYNMDNNLVFDITSGDIVPPFRDSSSLISYTGVDLDDYEYVILSLKDYSQTEAFSSTLHVKGMIGITPVYEFGTIEKNDVTDRCNASFSELTDYGFYILSSDLINNAIYYVKACEDNTYFEFDNTVFDIAYVTTENVDDPVVTVGGVAYSVIPFNKLTTTANSNEENNFIPGQNGSSLTDVIDNTVSYVTSFWSSLTTFMGLVTKFFNTLPIEIRAIAITTFSTACTLGLLKILKS